MTEENRDYKQKIKSLLENYEDGWNVFTKAPDWDVTPARVPGAEDANIPESWVELADKVISTIAHGKYDLKTYPNVIEIIDAEQMMDGYASVGMPISYNHWSFGKTLVQQDDAYKKGQMGLAYEIVINTNPSIAYCMENNTKTMQMLVIAHANYGHNSFFKNNHLFKQFTKADEILDDLLKLKHDIEKYETRYGYDAVEKLLDSCHALQMHGVDRYNKPRARTPEEEAARRAKIEEIRQQNVDVVMDTTLGKTTKAFNEANDNDIIKTTGDMEENLLAYIAAYAPHLQDWQRDLMQQMSNKAQYFYPQMQTQVMNEGWATFWHYTIMNDLNEMGLIDEAMWEEFVVSHTNVIKQPEHDETVLVRGPDGQPQEVPIYNGINPYALGFNMFRDIKRICLEPTEEDYKWFPEFAGNSDWVSVMKDAMENYKDESFILQFLSPKLIRDLKLFAIRDDDHEDTMEVIAIQDEYGYQQIRESLSSQYRLSDNQPRIEVADYNYKGDRSLTLRHTMHNRRPIEKSDMQEVLKHIYRLWQHPVILESRSPEGFLVDDMSCPPDIREDSATAKNKTTARPRP